MDPAARTTDEETDEEHERAVDAEALRSLAARLACHAARILELEDRLEHFQASELRRRLR